jgi:uncharacterized protein YdiU (UPF0061 family)
LPRGAAPIASVYSGHQFGQYVPQLGDGRAVLIGEIATAVQTCEIQLKGAGVTPFSRRGDGRAVLRSSIREYLMAEALHHLGIPTTRSLCLVADPTLTVWRERAETAAVVTRLAPSFIRFGHFEYFYYTEQWDALKTLADHVIAHHLPQCLEQSSPYAALLAEVIQRTATLVAQWQAYGFCHGVMNTDNMSILGLTIDYGPFAMMDGFDAGYVCNHSDVNGRYAYYQQPYIAHWNLHALAQTFVPLLDGSAGSMRSESSAAHDKESTMQVIQHLLATFPQQYQHAYQRIMAQKLGVQLHIAEHPDYAPQHAALTALLDELHAMLHAGREDWTGFFWHLSVDETALLDTVKDRERLQTWLQQWHQLVDGASIPNERQTAMQSVNPRYVLRNHLLQIAIEHAERGDYSEINRLWHIMRQPFTVHPQYEAYANPPPDDAQGVPLSCSS